MPRGPASGFPPNSNGKRAAMSQPVAGNFLDPLRPHPKPAPQTSGIAQLYGDAWEWTRSSYEPYPGFRPFEGRGGRIQRQVHVRSDGAARRFGGNAARPYPPDLPEFLPARGPLAILRHSACGGRMTSTHRFGAAPKRPIPADIDFPDALLEGLSREPKRIACKYFYDAEGANLFQQICALPEYYLTRTELSLLQAPCAGVRAADRPGCRDRRIRRRLGGEDRHPARSARSAARLCAGGNLRRIC